MSTGYPPPERQPILVGKGNEIVTAFHPSCRHAKENFTKCSQFWYNGSNFECDFYLAQSIVISAPVKRVPVLEFTPTRA